MLSRPSTYSFHSIADGECKDIRQEGKEWDYPFLSQPNNTGPSVAYTRSSLNLHRAHKVNSPLNGAAACSDNGPLSFHCKSAT